MDTSGFIKAAREALEVRVVVRDDGAEARIPIWIVTVGDAVFVRSYRAEQGKWYQHVVARPRFPLELAGEDVVVEGRAASRELLADVSQAYLAKYAGQPETPDMVSPRVVATTLQLVLAQAGTSAG
jgi:hypothetical protein